MGDIIYKIPVMSQLFLTFEKYLSPFRKRSVVLIQELAEARIKIVAINAGTKISGVKILSPKKVSVSNLSPICS